MDSIECYIQEDPIQPADLRQTLPQVQSCGGFASFEGLVRNTNHGKQVKLLEYETYDELALKEIRRICESAQYKYGTKFIRVVHRKGVLEIGQIAVIIQVLSPHRAEAFAACKEIIDELKCRAPIWKREVYFDDSYSWTRCSELNHSPNDHCSM